MYNVNYDIETWKLVDLLENELRNLQRLLERAMLVIEVNMD